MLMLERPLSHYWTSPLKVVDPIYSLKIWDFIEDNGM